MTAFLQVNPSVKLGSNRNVSRTSLREITVYAFVKRDLTNMKTRYRLHRVSENLEEYVRTWLVGMLRTDRVPELIPLDSFVVLAMREMS